MTEHAAKTKLGILGGGQLGRMLALAAHPLGVEPLVVDPKRGCSAHAVAPVVAADWDDPAALDALARCDVVTYEFENVPTPVVERLATRVAVSPPIAALAHTSDRLLEKRLLESVGLAPARHRPVDREEDLHAAARALGLPAVLKTRRLGYDGRGQRVLLDASDLRPAWDELGGRPLLLEAHVPFDREVSILAVRSADGEVRFWAPTENVHVAGILRVSRAPAPGIDDEDTRPVRARIAALLDRLDYVGVIAVELFVRGDEWIANEIACRVHNSGHWTVEGAATSQFENHVRAVTGRPLGSTETVAPTAMVNLIGSLPDERALLEVPGARLHVYGKAPAPGRKLGHVTVSGATRERVDERLEQVARVVGDRDLLDAVPRLGAAARAPGPTDRRPAFVAAPQALGTA